MLNDVLKLTKRVYNEFLVNGKVPISPMCLYDSYRHLTEVINKTYFAANHSLALRLDESFLQHSSLDEAKETWRNLLNGDLEALTESIKKHLLQLQVFAVGDLEERTYLLEDRFNAKVYHGFVKFHYNVGYLNIECTQISCEILTTTYDPKKDYITSKQTMDVSTYEKREQLKTELIDKSQRLNTLKNDLVLYIKKHYTIENLFYQESRVVH